MSLRSPPSGGTSTRLHHSEWDSDNGRRQKLEVIARNVEFLDARKTDDTPATAEEGAEPGEAF